MCSGKVEGVRVSEVIRREQVGVLTWWFAK